MKEKIEPKFDSTVLGADKLKNEVRNLIDQKTIPLPHRKIFGQILDQIQLVSFRTLAFPEIAQLKLQLNTLDPKDDEYKRIQDLIKSKNIKKNDFVVLVVEQVLKTAVKNRLGLCKSNDYLYLYNGAFWEVIDENALAKFLGEAAERMGIYKL